MALWEKEIDSAPPEKANWDLESSKILNQAINKSSSTPLNLRDTDTFKVLEAIDAATSGNLEDTATMRYLNSLEA
jgi:hypothetical protein